MRYRTVIGARGLVIHPLARGPGAASRRWFGREQVADREQGSERVAALLEDLRRTLAAVDHGQHAHDFGLVRLRGLGGDQRALAARDHVVEDRDALVAGEVALDLAAHAVVLRHLAHEESLERLAVLVRPPHDAGHQRIGSQREAADGGDVVGLELLPEQLRDQLEPLGMQARLADVDVVVRSGAGAEDELAETHRALEQHLAKAITIGLGHGSRVLKGEWARRARVPMGRFGVWGAPEVPSSPPRHACYTVLRARSGGSRALHGRSSRNRAFPPCDRSFLF